MAQLQLYYLHTFFGGRYLSDTILIDNCPKIDEPEVPSKDGV